MLGNWGREVAVLSISCLPLVGSGRASWRRISNTMMPPFVIVVYFSYRHGATDGEQRMGISAASYRPLGQILQGLDDDVIGKALQTMCRREGQPLSKSVHGWIQQ